MIFSADKCHTSVFLFILTVGVRRFFTFIFSFSRKLLISNGQWTTSLADARFRLRSGELRRTRGMARPMPHCPPRPSDPRRHFHISDFMRAHRTLRVLICGCLFTAVSAKHALPGRLGRIKCWQIRVTPFFFLFILIGAGNGEDERKSLCKTGLIFPIKLLHFPV